MYFVLTRKVADIKSHAILQGQSLYIERLRCSFETGGALAAEKIKSPITFRFSEFALRGDMTDHLNINSIPGPVFSADFKTLLEKNGIGNIEYFQLTLVDEFIPVQVGTPKKPQIEYKTVEYTDYFIANVVGLVDCVDHQESILEYFYPPELRNPQEETQDINDEVNHPFAGENPNEIDFITKLVLDESKIDPALKVFRLKDQPHLLIFHEDVVEKIRKEKLSGFVFVPVSEYTDAIPDNDNKENLKENDQNQKQPEQKHDLKMPEATDESTRPKKRRLLF